jgi:hypothetical protein
MIKYSINKVIQVLILLSMPVYFSEHITEGEWLMSFITFIIMKVYLKDLHEEVLEKELHGEL